MKTGQVVFKGMFPIDEPESKVSPRSELDPLIPKKSKVEKQNLE